VRRFVFLVCLVLVAFSGGAFHDDYDSAEWKREIAEGYLPYRELAFEDFPVSDGYPTRHLMRTIGFLHYSFRANVVQEGARMVARIQEISVRSGFDQNRSWKKSTFSEKKALLAHEQGHLDLNELCAADFKKAKRPEGIGTNPKAAVDDLSIKLEALCQQCGSQFKIEQERYDVETIHGANLAKQTEWQDAIRKRLAAQGIESSEKR
jgi:hypothetical protein